MAVKKPSALRGKGAPRRGLRVSFLRNVDPTTLQPKLQARDLIWIGSFQEPNGQITGTPICNNALQSARDVNSQRLRVLGNQGLWYSAEFQETFACYIRSWLLDRATADEDARELMDQLERMGGGTYGSVFSNRFTRLDQPGRGLVLIKSPLNDRVTGLRAADQSAAIEEASNNLLHERNIAFGGNGDGTNSLRSALPTFTYVYDIVRCGAPITAPQAGREEERASVWCDPESDAVNLIEEQVRGKSVSDILRNLRTGETTMDPEDFAAVYLQLLYALSYADRTIGFAHNDLSTNNAVVRPYMRPVAIAMPASVGKLVRIRTKYIVQIIDYGMAHLAPKGKEYVGKVLGSVVFDAFFFLATASLNLSVGNPKYPTDPREVPIINLVEQYMKWFTDVPLADVTNSFRNAKGNIVPFFARIPSKALDSLIAYVITHSPDLWVTQTERLPTIDCIHAPKLTDPLIRTNDPVNIHTLRRWYDLQPGPVVAGGPKAPEISRNQVLANTLADIAQTNTEIIQHLAATTNKSVELGNAVMKFLHLEAIYQDADFLRGTKWIYLDGFNWDSLQQAVDLTQIQLQIALAIQVARVPSSYKARLLDVLQP